MAFFIFLRLYFKHFFYKMIVEFTILTKQLSNKT